MWAPVSAAWYAVHLKMQVSLAYVQQGFVVERAAVSSECRHSSAELSKPDHEHGSIIITHLLTHMQLSGRSGYTSTWRALECDAA